MTPRIPGGAGHIGPYVVAGSGPGGDTIGAGRTRGARATARRGRQARVRQQGVPSSAPQPNAPGGTASSPPPA